ncbi:3-deoxy-D-manno-octulosonic acid kinase [Marinomonas sp. IMCC 4694]|uniref:3-deoxy-D-manno-octulosonic acid kinase n=1 Tax=Marinomonas sp. IMCC 4694 TaxID=2605432 RepID=UPI0011E625C4|nr:3-deoxy-D-manno-octulosonic acid kinase [Marinomonas sp. IMCC 4694]TYL48303.1 3-deoxy-D-manno-octulosonic acid kinase [Marinomonas sp. IMCC 4694]
MPQTITLSPNTQLIKSDVTLPVTDAWFEPGFWQAQNALSGTGNGRGAVWFIHNELGDFVIRRYHRGGLIAKFNKALFLYTGLKSTRPWLELHLLEKMRALNLPVPRPIAGLITTHNGFYRSALITETIANASDLFEMIKAGKSHTLDWNNIGHVIKRFHDHGIYHSDLNCHNIMVDQLNTVWVIDFDKCEQRPINPIWQQNNLDRLKRSLNKESEKQASFTVTDTQWNHFLEGYRG